MRYVIVVHRTVDSVNDWLLRQSDHLQDLSRFKSVIRIWRNRIPRVRVYQVFIGCEARLRLNRVRRNHILSSRIDWSLIIICWNFVELIVVLLV